MVLIAINLVSIVVQLTVSRKVLHKIYLTNIEELLFNVIMLHSDDIKIFDQTCYMNLTIDIVDINVMLCNVTGLFVEFRRAFIGRSRMARTGMLQLL